jgi:purine-binding chemotaxis protein CheW
MVSERQVCTFLLGSLLLGIDVQQVQEVLRSQPMTRVPLAPRAVRGLLNLRGQIVTAIDLRERLGLPSGDGGGTMNVVVRSEEGAVSLLVDEIGDVLETDAALYEAPPGTLEGPARDLVRSVYKLPDRLLLILETERTLALEGSGR